MSQYTFPFSTCEKPNNNNIVLQPYSAFVNLLSCIVIFYYLCKIKHFYSFFLIFFIFCFQLFHMFSHCFHIPGFFHIFSIHSLSYCINISLLYALYIKTKKSFTTEFILFLMLFVALDIYSLLNLSLIYYVICQSVIFLGILFYYYHVLPVFIQEAIKWVFFLIIFILILEQNEINNCHYMLSMNSSFPYHIVIEFSGLILFYIVCSRFAKL